VGLGLKGPRRAGGGRKKSPAIIDKKGLIPHKTAVAVGESSFPRKRRCPRPSPALIIFSDHQTLVRISEEVRELRFQKRVTRRHRARTTEPDRQKCGRRLERVN